MATAPSPGADAGKRARHKRITRSELLTAGRRLFSQRGLYESRIEDLTNEAGIAKGTLYGYFANKDELIREVVARGFDELLVRVRGDAQGAHSRPDLIARVVRAHMDFFDENPDLMRVFHQVRGMLKFNRPEWRPLRATLAHYLSGLAEALRAPGGGKSPGPGQRQDAARILFGAVSGVTSVRAALWPGRVRAVVPKAVSRAIVSMLLTYESQSDAPARPSTPRRASRHRAPRRRRRPGTRSNAPATAGRAPRRLRTPAVPTPPVRQEGRVRKQR